jgi:uncharacterized protein with gpF-like domain
MAHRRGTEKAYQSAFNRVLMTARREVLSKLDKLARSHGGTPLAPEASPLSTRAAASSFLFSLPKFEDGLLAAMRKAGTAALKAAGEQLFAEVGKDDPFETPMPQALAFLKYRENKMKDVAQEVFDSVKAELQSGFDAGETTEELAARIRGKFTEMSHGKSKTVAITETAAAYGTGRQAAMEQAGVAYKAWLTSGNDNVRDSHRQAGETYDRAGAIPVDEPFIVEGDQGDEELMHPGDQNGSPGNVINCHCVSIAVKAPGGAAEEGEEA